MMSEQELVEKLREKGVAEKEIPKTMRDVGLIILGRAMEVMLATLPESERKYLARCTPNEVDAYIKEHPELLANINQERFDTIHDDTWNEYFAAVA